MELTKIEEKNIESVKRLSPTRFFVKLKNKEGGQTILSSHPELIKQMEGLVKKYGTPERD